FYCRPRRIFRARRLPETPPPRNRHSLHVVIPTGAPALCGRGVEPGRPVPTTSAVRPEPIPSRGHKGSRRTASRCFCRIALLRNSAEGLLLPTDAIPPLRAAKTPAGMTAGRRALVQIGDAVDLDVDALPVRRAADAGARRLMLAHDRAEGLVEFREIGDVAQAHPHVDDVGERGPAGLEHGDEVREGPPRLRLDVALDHLLGLGIERPLPRDVEERPRLDRLHDRRRLGLVGEPGRRRLAAPDDLLRHSVLPATEKRSRGDGEEQNLRAVGALSAYLPASLVTYFVP